MNIKPIIYNYLITIANGSIHFHAFSYQYTGSGYNQAVNLVIDGLIFLWACRNQSNGRRRVGRR